MAVAVTYTLEEAIVFIKEYDDLYEEVHHIKNIVTQKESLRESINKETKEAMKIFKKTGSEYTQGVEDGKLAEAFEKLKIQNDFQDEINKLYKKMGEKAKKLESYDSDKYASCQDIVINALVLNLNETISQSDKVKKFHYLEKSLVIIDKINIQKLKKNSEIYKFLINEEVINSLGNVLKEYIREYGKSKFFTDKVVENLSFISDLKIVLMSLDEGSEVKIKTFDYIHKIAHSFGFLKPKVVINGQEFGLSLSFPNELANETYLHGMEFASTYNVRSFEKYCRKKFESQKYCKARQELKGKGFEISQHQIKKNIDGALHLTSLVVCKSEFYGTLIALGDRGSETFNGVQFYKLHPEVGCSKFIEDIKYSRGKYSSSICESVLFEDLRLLKADLIYEIQVLQQFGDYCGFKSAAEIDEFSASMFAAVHCSISKKDAPLPLYDALASAELIAVPYHIQQMKDFRVKQIQEFSKFLEKNYVRIDRDTILAFHCHAKRYGINIMSLGINVSGITNGSETYYYEKYFRKKNWFNLLEARVTITGYVNDETRKIRKDVNEAFERFILLYQFTDEFHHEGIEKLKYLFGALTLCNKHGIKETIKNVKLGQSASLLLSRDLSRKKPLITNYGREDSSRIQELPDDYSSDDDSDPRTEVVFRF